MNDFVMPTGRCPLKTCGSTDIHRHPAKSPMAQRVASAWGNKVACPIDQCLTCNTIWEPWPDGTSSDCVEREPCDNCAYRAGSVESLDKKSWEELIGIAQRAASGAWFEEDTSKSHFCCHKGIPIRIDNVKNTISFDFESAGVDLLTQTCRGFLNVMWAIQDRSKCCPQSKTPPKMRKRHREEDFRKLDSCLQPGHPRRSTAVVFAGGSWTRHL